MPAISYPGIRGKLVPHSRANLPLRVSGSAGFTPPATTRTSASSSFGSGRGTSSNFNTSGAPYSCAITASIIGLSPAPNAALEPRIAKSARTRIRRKAVSISVNLACDCVGGECLVVVSRILRPARPPLQCYVRGATYIDRRVHPGLMASREREPKGAAFSGLALNADLSMVRVHSKPAKSEPQASRMPMLAATVCLPKFFKNVFVLVARYSLAVVADRKGDISLCALNIYPDCSV